MGIGDNGNNDFSNNNSNRLFENTYYSRIKCRSEFNDEVKTLSYEFRSGLLAIKISQSEGNGKWNDLASISLSPTKAYILSQEISKFKEYLNGSPKDNVGFGVNGGMREKISFINLHSNKNKEVFITIGNFNADSGAVVEMSTVQLNTTDYHNSLSWDKIPAIDVAMSVNKTYYPFIELDQLQMIVSDFARHMTGALAYSVVDLQRYDTQRMLNKIDPIYDKLGIERKSYGNNNRAFQGSSFLSNTGSSYNKGTSNPTSVDDIGDLISDDEIPFDE